MPPPELDQGGSQPAPDSPRLRRRPAVPLPANVTALFCGAEEPLSPHGIAEHFYRTRRPTGPQILPEAPALPSRRHDPESPRTQSNGCGARVHDAVRAREAGWFGWGAGRAGTVIPLDAAYFDASALVALQLDNGNAGLLPCGCAVSGVGCAVCGNALGARQSYCSTHARLGHTGEVSLFFLASTVTPSPASSNAASSSTTSPPTTLPSHAPWHITAGPEDPDGIVWSPDDTLWAQRDARWTHALSTYPTSSIPPGNVPFIPPSYPPSPTPSPPSSPPRVVLDWGVPASPVFAPSTAESTSRAQGGEGAAGPHGAEGTRVHRPLRRRTLRRPASVERHFGAGLVEGRGAPLGTETEASAGAPARVLTGDGDDADDAGPATWNVLQSQTWISEGGDYGRAWRLRTSSDADVASTSATLAAEGGHGDDGEGDAATRAEFRETWGLVLRRGDRSDQRDQTTDVANLAAAASLPAPPSTTLPAPHARARRLAALGTRIAALDAAAADVRRTITVLGEGGRGEHAAQEVSAAEGAGASGVRERLSARGAATTTFSAPTPRSSAPPAPAPTLPSPPTTPTPTTPLIITPSPAFLRALYSEQTALLARVSALSAELDSLGVSVASASAGSTTAGASTADARERAWASTIEARDRADRNAIQLARVRAFLERLIASRGAADGDTEREVFRVGGRGLREGAGRVDATVDTPAPAPGGVGDAAADEEDKRPQRRRTIFER
ncbi:hypothetical protein B0H15DRAFT_443974 [Mycena belliarum]|uniref:Uncharacterized protein n=1 Tax=Mycena belliarum TaxID=1033014 RepID=A0AAD6U1X8_9AGAR|nr:hypothetical protein B0H15DRAFT_443974 [Mycena belliae]